MFKGVTLGFFAFALFSLSDACIKAIHGALPPYQMSFFGAAFSIVVLPFIWRRGETVMDLVRAKRPWLWLTRGALGTLGSFSSVTAFSHLSMAEAFALIFLMPLATTALSVFFLKEKVNRQGWAAIVLGFVGVLIVLRPGFREIGIGHIAALTCGICGSALSVLLRYVGRDEKPVNLFGAAMIAPMVISAVLMVPGYVAPTAPQWLAILGFAVMAAGANILLMAASRRSPASRIAPTQYSQMLWGLMLGYVFFGDRIDGFTAAGVIVIVGAGLWLFLPKAARTDSAE